MNTLATNPAVTMLSGTVLFGYRGSVAHGMYIPSNDPNSIDDIDLMGVVIGESKHYFGLCEWGSRGTKEMWEGHYDIVYYEIRKMFSLLLQGNPNVISMLWMHPDHYLIKTESGSRIIANRGLFVGKHVYNAFAGYAHQQLEKMETREPGELREYLAVTAELKYRGAHPNHKGEHFPDPIPQGRHDNKLPRDLGRATGEVKDAANWDTDKLLQRLRHYQKKGENIGYMGEKRKRLVLDLGYDAKNAAHLIRLLRMCKEFMATGEMTVLRPDAEELLDIKRGRWKLEDIKALSNELFNEIREARDKSPLPTGPNREGAEKLLVDIIHEALKV